MPQVPIWQQDIPDLPGANAREPHATPDTFGEQIGTAQAKAGADIGRGLNTLGDALTSNFNEQQAINSQTVVSDHETAVNNKAQEVFRNTPPDQTATIPDQLNQFAQDDWNSRRPGVQGRYQAKADATVHDWHNTMGTQWTAQTVKMNDAAVDAQLGDSTQGKAADLIQNPQNLASAINGLKTQIEETNQPVMMQRQAKIKFGQQLFEATRDGMIARAAAEPMNESLTLAATQFAKDGLGQISDGLGIQPLTPTTPGPVNQQRVQKTMADPAIASAVNQVSAETGMPADQLAVTTSIESNGNPRASTGSYKGLTQLSDDEFAKYGPPGGNIFDPHDNLLAGARKMQADTADFQKQYGRPPTPTDMYLIHQQGPAGFAAHMANPNAPAWQNMYSTGEGRQKGVDWAKAAIWGNIPQADKARFGSVDNVTSADFMHLWDTKVTGNTGQPGTPSAPGTPPPGATFQGPLPTAHGNAGAPGNYDPNFFTSRGNVSIRNVNPVFAERLQALAADAEKATNSPVQFNEVDRSTAQQAIYHDRYLRGTGGIAAAPGTGRHEYEVQPNGTEAADIAAGPARTWMKANAPRYGIEQLAGDKDPPHFQLARNLSGPVVGSQKPIASAVPGVNPMPGAGQPPANAGQPPAANHMAEANAALNMTPQEQNLYQMHLDNLAKGGVPNNGGLSTLYQASVEHDGKTYNIPTVWDGKIVPPDQAQQRVAAIGWDKFPSYDSTDQAEKRYDQMHAYMERDTGDYLNAHDPNSKMLVTANHVPTPQAPADSFAAPGAPPTGTPPATPLTIHTSGGWTVIPTTGPNGETLSDSDAVNQWGKTGNHLGVFGDQTSANQYVDKLTSKAQRAQIAMSPTGASMPFGKSIKEWEQAQADTAHKLAALDAIRQQAYNQARQQSQADLGQEDAAVKAQGLAGLNPKWTPQSLGMFTKPEQIAVIQDTRNANLAYWSATHDFNAQTSTPDDMSRAVESLNPQHIDPQSPAFKVWQSNYDQAKSLMTSTITEHDKYLTQVGHEKMKSMIDTVNHDGTITDDMINGARDFLTPEELKQAYALQHDPPVIPNDAATLAVENAIRTMPPDDFQKYLMSWKAQRAFSNDDVKALIGRNQTFWAQGVQPPIVDAQKWLEEKLTPGVAGLEGKIMRGAMADAMEDLKGWAADPRNAPQLKDRAAVMAKAREVYSRYGQTGIGQQRIGTGMSVYFDKDVKANDVSQKDVDAGFKKLTTDWMTPGPNGAKPFSDDEFGRRYANLKQWDDILKKEADMTNEGARAGSTKPAQPAPKAATPTTPPTPAPPQHLPPPPQPQNQQYVQ